MNSAVLTQILRDKHAAGVNPYYAKSKPPRCGQSITSQGSPDSQLYVLSKIESIWEPYQLDIKKSPSACEVISAPEFAFSINAKRPLTL